MWTLLVLLLVPNARFRSPSQLNVTAEDFCFGESNIVLPGVSIPNRAWMNLLEAPVLFYLACIIIFSIHATNQNLVALAWAYVGLRMIHMLVHVTYNNVLHRLLVFCVQQRRPHRDLDTGDPRTASAGVVRSTSKPT